MHPCDCRFRRAAAARFGARTGGSPGNRAAAMSRRMERTAQATRPWKADGTAYIIGTCQRRFVPRHRVESDSQTAASRATSSIGRCGGRAGRLRAGPAQGTAQSGGAVSPRHCTARARSRHRCRRGTARYRLGRSPTWRCLGQSRARSPDAWPVCRGRGCSGEGRSIAGRARLSVHASWGGHAGAAPPNRSVGRIASRRRKRSA